MSIRGVFPGGPTRMGSGRGGAGAFHLPSMTEQEGARRRRQRRRTRFRRRARVVAGLATASALAMGVGVGLGWAARTTRDDRMVEPAPASTLDRVISAEVNRTLLELWKMEDLEHRGRAIR